MKESVLILGKKATQEADLVRGELTKWLMKKGFGVIDITQRTETPTPKEMRHVKLGVAIGGDGTFLTLVRRLGQKDQFPLLGVNLGSLGFITEVDKRKVISTIEGVLSHQFKEETRGLLDVKLIRKSKTVFAGSVFNDVVITKSSGTTLLRFDVYLGGELLSHVRADGYIVSTPTGSTAYCLSAGGPLVHPSVEASILLPICSHALSTRPMVVPMDIDIQIKMNEDRGTAYLVYDGQINFEMKSGDQVQIQKSEVAVRLIHLPGQNWNRAVKTKLQMA